MKTVRFTQVVERCGRPQVHTLWMAPEKDAELARAAKANRVMTVRADRGHAEAGEVGFDVKEAKRAGAFQLFIFPKSLARFKDARVVGIKFDLIAQPRLVRATAPPRAGKGRRHKRLRGGVGSPSRPGLEKRLKIQSTDRPETQAGSESRPHLVRTPPSHRPAHRAEGSDLRTAIRAALEDLEAGEAVAAYRLLQRALKT